MSEIERCAIENDLAMHTAPTLLGVKCANLISVKQSEKTISEYLTESGISGSSGTLRARVLCRCRERILVYVYQEHMLSAWLSTGQVRDFLEEYGYCSDMDIDTMLDILASRMKCGDFPHEIGAFLGYPIGDIRGFIDNQGKNCLMCGYWKVYENAASAQKTFQMYDRCRKILCDRLKKGLNLFQAISKEEI